MTRFFFLKTLTISLLLSIGIAIGVHAQWEQLEEPYGGEIFAIVQMDNTIYAGGNHLFTSTDNGRSWQVLTTFEKGNVFNLLVFNDYLFAGTSSDLYRSADAGETWLKLNIPASLDGLNQICRVNNTLIMNTGHAQTPEIYLSEDNGDSWNLSEQEPEDGFIRSVTSIGQIVYACGDFGIYRSTDEGHHWEVFAKDLHFTETLTYANNTFIAARWRGCYRSADGVTWDTVWNELNIPSFILPLDSVSGKVQRLILGTTTSIPDPGGLFYSDDNGLTWSSFQNVNKGNAKIYCIFKSDDFLLTGTCSDAILRSDSMGNNWSVSNTGIKNRRFYKVASGGDLLVASEINERAIFSSGDHGKTWQFQGIPSNDFEYVTCLSVKEDWIFVGTIDKLYRKKVSDTVWSICLDTNYIRKVINTGQFVFVATPYSLYRSEDDGTTWKTVDFGDGIIWEFLAYDSILCVITGQKVYNSTDAGISFNSTANLYFGGDYRVSSNYENIFYVAQGPTGVFRSVDGGVVWEQMCDTAIWFPTEVLANTGTIFISTEMDGVIRSLDNGHTWCSYNDGMTAISTMGLTLMGDTLFAVGYDKINSGAGCGVMKRSAYPAGIPTANDHNPDCIVFPNPARNIITVRYSIHRYSKAQYAIYSLSGNLLKSGHIGTNESIYVNDLSPGNYIITIFDSNKINSAPFTVM